MKRILDTMYIKEEILSYTNLKKIKMNNFNFKHAYRWLTPEQQQQLRDMIGLYHLGQLPKDGPRGYDPIIEIMFNFWIAVLPDFEK
jgi:hypothetical protein